jgi:hypothetical protein
VSATNTFFGCAFTVESELIKISETTLSTSATDKAILRFMVRLSFLGLVIDRQFCEFADPDEAATLFN